MDILRMLTEPMSRQDLHTRVWNDLMSDLGELTDEQVSKAARAANNKIDAYAKGGLIKEVGGKFKLTKAGKEMLDLEPDPYSEEERRECYV